VTQPAQPTTEQQLARWLGLALQPLTELATDPARRSQLLAGLGFTPPVDIPNLGLDSATLDDFGQAVDALVAGIAAGDAGADEYAAVLIAVVELISDLLGMGDRLEAVLDQAYRDATHIVELLPERLLHWLLVEQLRRQTPFLLGVLTAVGLVDDTEVGGAPYSRLRLDRLGLLTNPAALLTEVYGWGTATPRLDVALERLMLLLRAVWSPAELRLSAEAAETAAGGEPPGDDVDEARLPVLAGDVYGVQLDAGVVLRLVAAGGVERSGFALGPFLDGTATVTVPVGSGRWTLDATLAGEVTLDAITIRPGPGGTGVEVLPPGGVVAGGKVALGLTRKNPDASPVRLASVAGIAVAEAVSVGAALSAGASTTGTLDLGLELAIGQGVVRFGTGQADGFLAKALPPGGIQADLDLVLGWATGRGFYVRGGAGIEVSIPVHTTYFGVLTIDTVDLGAFLGAAGTLDVEVAATFRVELGPVKAAVQRMGVRAALSFPAGGGNLGPAQLAVAFRPPDGAGVAIAAGPVRGGGYVLNDARNGKYAGILQLAIADTLKVTAICLVSTRMPDGRRGFSLLVIIAVEFPPIQLGYGFTLNGVGGLLGANRSMDIHALQGGVRNRGIDSVLFPPDPVANAPKVIRDLESFFPVAEGQFCIGIMAALGWGSPTLIKVEIGIVIELPNPIRLALLGRLSLVLPDEEAGVVVLKIVILGAIDFAAKEISIDATIYDSKIAAFAISGDFALRLSYGAAPAFAVSVGGFNPRFTPPPGFPQLSRVQVSLATVDNPRIRLEAYLAATPTSVQAGARIEVFAEVSLGALGTFSALAFFSFDALVYLVPRLSFIVDLAGGVSIKHNGHPFLSAQISLTLSGPEPFQVAGYAEIDFFGKHRLPIEATIGEEPPPVVLAPGDPIADLLAALGLAGNWTAQLPPATFDGTRGVVSVRDLGDLPPDLLLVHPFGTIATSQRVVPLDVTLQKYAGTAVPAGAEVLSLRVAIDGRAAAGTEVREAFPAGQFFELSDDAKLVGEAFPRFRSGLSGITVPAQPTVPAAVSGVDGYETSVVNPAAWWPSRTQVGYTFAASTLDALAAAGAAGRAATRTAGSAGYTGAPSGLAVAEKGYRLASTDTLQAGPAVYATMAEAEAAGAGLAGVQVVGAHEGAS
jgi:hypothetical protein